MSEFRDKFKNKKKFKPGVKLGLAHITILELIKVLGVVNDKRNPSDMYCRIILKQGKNLLDNYFENPKAKQFDYDELLEFQNINGVD